MPHCGSVWQSRSGQPQAAIVQTPQREHLRLFLSSCHLPQGLCLTRNLFDLTWGPLVSHCDLYWWLPKQNKKDNVRVFTSGSCLSCPTSFSRRLAPISRFPGPQLPFGCRKPGCGFSTLHPCSPISSYSLFLASSPQYVFAYMFSGKPGQLTRLSFFGCGYTVMSVGTHMSVGVHVCACGCGCQRTTSRSFHKHLPPFGVWLVGKSGHPAVTHLVITGVVSEHCHIQICMCILGI